MYFSGHDCKMKRGRPNRHGWACDAREMKCSSGMTAHGQFQSCQSYRCNTHDFDLCLTCAVQRREVSNHQNLTHAQKVGYIQVWYRENGDIAIACLQKHQAAEIYKTNKSQNKLLINSNQIIEVREFSFTRKTTDLIQNAY